MKMLILLFINVFADQTTFVTNSAGCTDGQNSCTTEEVRLAINKAEDKAMLLFISASQSAVANQSNTCQIQVNNFNGQCNSSLFNSIILNIESINQEIKNKMVQFSDVSSIARNAKERGATVTEILVNLEELQKEIEAAKNFVLEQEKELHKLNTNCESSYKDVAAVCVPPTVASNGERTVLNEISLVGPEQIVVEKAGVEAGRAEATALVQMNGDLDAPKIESQRRNFESSFNATSRVGGTAFEAVNGANSFADDSISDIQNIIKSLQPLRETFTNQNETCDAVFGCQPTKDGASPDHLEARALAGIERAEAAQRAAAGATPTADATSRSAGGGGASAEEVMSSAQDSAYGGSPTVNVNTTNTGAAPQGAAGAGGGFAGALSGLSSMLGKATGGAFGDSSSYSNNYGSSRYGSSARTNNGGSYPTESYDYSLTKQKTATGFNNPPARGFQPQAGGLPSNNGSNPNAGAQGGAGAGLSGSGSSGSGGTNADKPSLFSRLFGKKDKTLFSNKSSGGGGGGSFGGASSKTGYSPTGASLDSNGLQDPSNPNGGRSFDPSKYMPSKAAEERAYLRSTGRSTGRKIASHSLGDGSASDFQWPNDISKNKNMNLFKTVNIIHRAKLSQ